MAKSCPECGEHRWAAAGFCLSLQCSGHHTDPDYPINAPPEMKWNVKSDPKMKKKKAPAAPKAPKKGRRALEIQYESRGEIAPWLENQNPDGS